jgi:hypothetical protein
LKKGTLIAFLIAVVFAVVLWQLPRTAYQNPPEVVSEEGNPLDEKVDEAVAIIQNGEGAPYASDRNAVGGAQRRS